MEERVEEGSGTESDLWAFKAPDKGTAYEKMASEFT